MEMLLGLLWFKIHYNLKDKKIKIINQQAWSTTYWTFLSTKNLTPTNSEEPFLPQTHTSRHWSASTVTTLRLASHTDSPKSTVLSAIDSWPFHLVENSESPRMPGSKYSLLFLERSKRRRKNKLLPKPKKLRKKPSQKTLKKTNEYSFYV